MVDAFRHCCLPCECSSSSVCFFVFCFYSGLIQNCFETFLSLFGELLDLLFLLLICKLLVLKNCLDLFLVIDLSLPEDGLKLFLLFGRWGWLWRWRCRGFGLWSRLLGSLKFLLFFLYLLLALFVKVSSFSSSDFLFSILIRGILNNTMLFLVIPC